jgi:hypothetical protein
MALAAGLVLIGSLAATVVFLELFIRVVGIHGKRLSDIYLLPFVLRLALVDDAVTFDLLCPPHQIILLACISGNLGDVEQASHVSLGRQLLRKGLVQNLKMVLACSRYLRQVRILFGFAYIHF